MTPELLRAATGCSSLNAALYAEPLSAACERYDINTPARLAMFLAQVGHESGSLRFVREIWGPTPAQLRYEGRADLGNTQPGDGRRYSGHGLIQVTGRFNHAKTRDQLRADGFEDAPDFEADTQALELPKWACLSAARFWFARGCNALADAGNFDRTTQVINGGQTGAADRRARWARAKTALAPRSTTKE